MTMGPEPMTSTLRMVGSLGMIITSQNHGYAVVADSLKGLGGTETWVNANDGSCEGIDYPEKDCFTVQFHPEACSGPRDTGFLFDRFMHMMEVRKGASAHAEG